MKRLRIWTNGFHFVIAATALGAHLIVKRSPFGDGYEDGPSDWKPYEHVEFTYWSGDGPGAGDVTKPVDQWIAERGRGYFACSEY